MNSKNKQDAHVAASDDSNDGAGASRATTISTHGGTVQPFVDANGRTYWRARVTLCDGARPYLGPRFYNKLLAQEYAAEKSEAIKKRRITLAMIERIEREAAPDEGETCDEYFERLRQAREAKGISTCRQDASRWHKWISPSIGAFPIAAVTRDDIENIRNLLDDEVSRRTTQGGRAGLSGDTAQAIWSVLHITFSEAKDARNKGLRVRADDPTIGHLHPLRTRKREKTFIYPVEFLRLMACAEIPLDWRRAYAVAIYTYLRPEELQAILWTDVDFTAGMISVNKTVDGKTGTPCPLTKTPCAVRLVPIEPTLQPLLEDLHRHRASDDSPILPVLGELNDQYRALQIRAHLEMAGVTRPRLFMDTLTLIPVNFRSCRDSGITWLALKKGDAMLSTRAIARRCGHASAETTDGYVKLAEDLSGSIGQPFPVLPDWIVRS